MESSLLTDLSLTTSSREASSCKRHACIADPRMDAGDVEYRHAYLDMTNITVEASNYTRAGRTCPAAMGFSFAAGTTDGVHLTAVKKLFECSRLISKVPSVLGLVIAL